MPYYMQTFSGKGRTKFPINRYRRFSLWKDVRLLPDFLVWYLWEEWLYCWKFPVYDEIVWFSLFQEIICRWIRFVETRNRTDRKGKVCLHWNHVEKCHYRLNRPRHIPGISLFSSFYIHSKEMYWSCPCLYPVGNVFQ